MEGHATLVESRDFDILYQDSFILFAYTFWMSLDAIKYKPIRGKSQGKCSLTFIYLFILFYSLRYVHQIWQNSPFL